MAGFDLFPSLERLADVEPRVGDVVQALVRVLVSGNAATTGGSAAGVSEGRVFQSGSLFNTEASVSDAVPPSNV